jgi:cobalt/nickel transport system permease protein
MLLRIMAAVTLCCVLSFSTPMVEILETFRLLKLPGTIVDIAEMMFRYVFILNETAGNMRKAQLCRTTRRLSRIEQIRNTGYVAAYVISKSLDRSTKIYQAMLSRGYNEKNMVPVYFTAPIPSLDLCAGSILAAVPLIILAFNYFA